MDTKFNVPACLFSDLCAALSKCISAIEASKPADERMGQVPMGKASVAAFEAIRRFYMPAGERDTHNALRALRAQYPAAESDTEALELACKDAKEVENLRFNLMQMAASQADFEET